MTVLIQWNMCTHVSVGRCGMLRCWSEGNVDFPTGHDCISSRNGADESGMAITSCVLNVSPTRMHLPEMAAESYKTLLTTG